MTNTSTGIFPGGIILLELHQRHYAAVKLEHLRAIARARVYGTRCSIPPFRPIISSDSVFQLSLQNGNPHLGQINVTRSVYYPNNNFSLWSGGYDWTITFLSFSDYVPPIVGINSSLTGCNGTEVRARNVFDDAPRSNQVLKCFKLVVALHCDSNSDVSSTLAGCIDRYCG